MFGDLSHFPVNGGSILAICLYALLSMFVTGPLIGERMIAKSGWDQQCREVLQAELSSSAPAPEFRPRFDCHSLLGLFGEEGLAVCRAHGNPEFNLPLMDQVTAYQDRLEAFNQQRLANAAARAQDRCRCAVSVTLENRRLAFAIAVGSARLVMPAPVKNLSSELTAALHSPSCQMNGVSP